ncbi:MAG: hypothetical protein HRT71_01060 [Flavobacteriales bacterium]|nr:hypothetical protein [Flavobacteriales bacterium]
MGKSLLIIILLFNLIEIDACRAQMFVHDESYQPIEIPFIIDSTFINNALKEPTLLNPDVLELLVGESGNPMLTFGDTGLVDVYAINKIITDYGIGYLTLVKHKKGKSITLLFTIKSDDNPWFTYLDQLYEHTDYKYCWTDLKSMEDIDNECITSLKRHTFKYKWGKERFERKWLEEEEVH